ncbi:MAG: 6-phosphofructokinase, partial [Planctomycetota bacterium]
MAAVTSALVGNAVFAQSGGPTTVINSSMSGAVLEALKHPKVLKMLYGAKNGILGVLQEELFDFGKEQLADIQALRTTPAAAAGSCRYKVKTAADYARIVEVFQAHNIRYFFYAGGNDSMDTADKVAQLAKDKNYELCVAGIPKTIDNDLACTDHCPGYGSVAKYNATMIMESGYDTEALYTTDTTTVQEVMGRNAGWIAASCGLAHRTEEDAPHLIYVPEIPVSLNTLATHIREVLKRLGRCVIVVCEGCKNEKGEYLAEIGGDFGKDAFGHKQLGGAGEFVANFIEKEIGVKARRNKPGTLQRNGMHWASKTDADEAFACGREAVRQAAKGTTGCMITLVRK